MSTTEAPAARPDLSALPLDVQLRIEVAETQGATWSEDAHGVALRGLLGARVLFRVYPEGGTVSSLPHFDLDPALWGALQEGEHVGVDPELSGGVVRCWAARWRGDVGGWQRASSIGRAVCLAVLAKHGRDTSRYTRKEKHDEARF